MPMHHEVPMSISRRTQLEETGKDMREQDYVITRAPYYYVHYS